MQEGDRELGEWATKGTEPFQLLPKKHTRMKMATEPQCKKYAIQPRGAHTMSRFIQLPFMSPKMALKSEYGAITPAQAARGLGALGPASLMMSERSKQLQLARLMTASQAGPGRPDIIA